MSRKARTLLVAWIAVLLSGVLILALPVPYVVLTPTVPEDTLGTVQGAPVIDTQKANLVTYPTDGHLYLTTVAVNTGGVTMFSALRHWISGPDAVVPKSVEFPPSQSKSQTDQQNVKAMADSRQDAVVAALQEIHYPETIIGSFSDTSKAKGVLAVGDRITAIDGTALSTFAEVATQIGKHKPGDTVTVTVVRGGQTITRPVVLIANPDKPGAPLLGILRLSSIPINLPDVSGPSAGLMFALGIIDKLTPGSLTGGKSIAGTGTIDGNGNVGEIGGIQQKLHGAKSNGHATFFLVPAANCPEAKAAKVSGLTLVKIPAQTKDANAPTGLHVAYQDLLQISTGGTDYQQC